MSELCVRELCVCVRGEREREREFREREFREREFREREFREREFREREFREREFREREFREREFRERESSERERERELCASKLWRETAGSGVHNEKQKPRTKRGNKNTPRAPTDEFAAAPRSLSGAQHSAEGTWPAPWPATASSPGPLDLGVAQMQLGGFQPTPG